MPNIIMADPKGEAMNYNENTGAYYPSVLNVKISGGRGSGQNIPNFGLASRWLKCEALIEATVDSPIIVASTKGNRIFNDCTNLETIELLGGLDGAGASIAQNCPKLKTIVLGSIGYPCANNPTATTFQNSGGSVVGEKTITVYAKDSDTIPFAGEPFGLTGATVIYRSSTTGEVRTE